MSYGGGLVFRTEERSCGWEASVSHRLMDSSISLVWRRDIFHTICKGEQKTKGLEVSK